MQTTEVKICRAISQVMGRDVVGNNDSRLKEDLGMSSLNLVELTVTLHSLFGIDVGRRAAAKKMNVQTIGDISSLMESV